MKTPCDSVTTAPPPSTAAASHSKYNHTNSYVINDYKSSQAEQVVDAHIMVSTRVNMYFVQLDGQTDIRLENYTIKNINIMRGGSMDAHTALSWGNARH